MSDIPGTSTGRRPSGSESSHSSRKRITSAGRLCQSPSQAPMRSGLTPPGRCRNPRFRRSRPVADRLQHLQTVALARPQFRRQHGVRPAARRAAQPPIPHAPPSPTTCRRLYLVGPPRPAMPHQRRRLAHRAAPLQPSQNRGHVDARNLFTRLYGGASVIYDDDDGFCIGADLLLAGPLQLLLP